MTAHRDTPAFITCEELFWILNNFSLAYHILKASPTCANRARLSSYVPPALILTTRELPVISKSSRFLLAELILGQSIVKRVLRNAIAWEVRKTRIFTPCCTRLLSFIPFNQIPRPAIVDRTHWRWEFAGWTTLGWRQCSSRSHSIGVWRGGSSSWKGSSPVAPGRTPSNTGGIQRWH